MSIQLTLPPDLSERLHREAVRRGISDSAVTLEILNERLPPSDSADETIALLQSWIESDHDDEPDENYDLFKSLDNARTSDRPLFPDELKGISW